MLSKTRDGLARVSGAATDARATRRASRGVGAGVAGSARGAPGACSRASIARRCRCRCLLQPSKRRSVLRSTAHSARSRRPRASTGDREVAGMQAPDSDSASTTSTAFDQSPSRSRSRGRGRMRKVERGRGCEATSQRRVNASGTTPNDHAGLQHNAEESKRASLSSNRYHLSTIDAITPVVVCNAKSINPELRSLSNALRERGCTS